MKSIEKFRFFIFSHFTFYNYPSYRKHFKLWKGNVCLIFCQAFGKKIHEFLLNLVFPHNINRYERLHVENSAAALYNTVR